MTETTGSGRGGRGGRGGSGGDDDASPGRSARRVEQVAFEDELGFAFGRYAERVVLHRAIPDIRDGLKPVQRRIVYAMHEAGNTPDRPYRKSAKTIGDVMGNYHPHGDSAIYEALVRLAQSWKVRYPLVDGHGNFGSLDDDPPAAMRYTEARLAPIAMELMADIDRETVPWVPNFDEQAEEPLVLPAGFPNLLVNGTSGVSAGFATEVPPHNLREVVDACRAWLDDPSLDSRALMEHVRGPDFPTGGVLMGTDGLRRAYETGRGRVAIRARHRIERERDGKSVIVFDEIPYGVVKAEVVRQLDALRLEREVQGVVDVRDESDREGLRIVVEVGRQADPEGVLAYLRKRTDLQVNYNFNMVAIAQNTPHQCSLRDIVEAFVEHRREVVRRRSRYERERARKRLHAVEGLIRAVDILDDVIAAIRASQDRGEARGRLVELGFTEAQADAILDLRLVRLTNLQLLQLTEERDELHARIERLEAILGDPAVCDRVVGDELAEVAERYGDERRTSIQEEVERLDVSLEVVVKPQDVAVAVTEQGWIKRVSMASYQASGADPRAAGLKPGDRLRDVVRTRTTHKILVLSEAGRAFPIPVHRIPEAKWGEVGTALVNLCGVEPDEGIAAVWARETFPEERSLLLLTERGMVKATPLAELDSPRTTGLTAIRLDEGDRLLRALEPRGGSEEEGGEETLLTLTEHGRSIRFPVSQISVQGRSARGVRAMRLEAEDRLRDAVLVASGPAGSEGQDDTGRRVGVFTEAGYAKLAPLGEHPIQNRGGRGVRIIVARRAQAGHRCVRIRVVRPEDAFEVIDSEGGVHPVAASDIPVTRRDGRAWNLRVLGRGATIQRVHHEPAEPEGEADRSEASEAEEAQAPGAGEGEGGSPDALARPDPDEVAEDPDEAAG